jgi:arylsulfatase
MSMFLLRIMAKSRSFVKLLFFTTPIVLSSCSNNPPKDNRPNIVLLFADDMGYGDLGCYGATGYDTPNLDRLAGEGARFTNFYSVQAVCSASRAGLLTGCYPNRIGISGALMPWATNGLDSNVTTIAEMLRTRGYATAIFGKWHLGHLPQFLPLKHGFEEYFGLPYSNDMWPVNYDGQPFTDTSYWKSKYPPLPLIDGDSVVKEIHTPEDQEPLTTLYTERAKAFIEKNKTRPFFLYLPYTMVHVPLAVSDKFKGKTEKGLFGDVMMELDWSVGEVLAALEKYNLSENTLVIFTSDNGPWICFGNHAGSTGGLREGKGTSFEGGQREPFIACWPGQIPEGSVVNGLSATIDILPTLAEITESPLPENKIDGVSILPLLKGDTAAEPREVLLYYYHRNDLEAVRWKNWKLILPHSYDSYEGETPGKDGFPGGRHVAFIGKSLYNLATDPREKVDVIGEYPEVVAIMDSIVSSVEF